MMKPMLVKNRLKSKMRKRLWENKIHYLAENPLKENSIRCFHLTRKIILFMTRRKCKMMPTSNKILKKMTMMVSLASTLKMTLSKKSLL